MIKCLFPASRSCGPDWGADVCRQWAFTSHSLPDRLPCMLFNEKRDSGVLVRRYGVQLQPGEPRGSVWPVRRTHRRLGNGASAVQMKNLKKHFTPSWRPWTDAFPPFYCYYLTVGQLTLKNQPILNLPWCRVGFVPQCQNFNFNICIYEAMICLLSFKLFTE